MGYLGFIGFWIHQRRRYFGGNGRRLNYRDKGRDENVE